MADTLKTYRRLGQLQRSLATELRAEYLRIIVEANRILRRASHEEYHSKDEFVRALHRHSDGSYDDICLAVAQGQDFTEPAWEKVQDHLSEVLDDLFPYEDSAEPSEEVIG